MKIKAKLLVAVLSLSMLVSGCGGNNAKNNDASNSSAVNQEEGKKMEYWI
ncbi:putative lipoprotein [Anaerococcus hydrogenalis ACS-025-V-Sch4]|uniref:Putative lipoprotein n=1 Tax=Anaerococcus hydrogenalis ACS-025-V-Sch4 TaxID=879306 RepID=F0GZZ6_9FIRM|nr:hypothetical protein [Anaerococcus hydrogenalis]EGC84152.1 putative lipoprotein [Anaerococcus hydrogenalis ACS-025-V-Sch4]